MQVRPGPWDSPAVMTRSGTQGSYEGARRDRRRGSRAGSASRSRRPCRARRARSSPRAALYAASVELAHGARLGVVAVAQRAARRPGGRAARPAPALDTLARACLALRPSCRRAALDVEQVELVLRGGLAGLVGDVEELGVAHVHVDRLAVGRARLAGAVALGSERRVDHEHRGLVALAPGRGRRARGSFAARQRLQARQVRASPARPTPRRRSARSASTARTWACGPRSAPDAGHAGPPGAERLPPLPVTCEPPVGAGRSRRSPARGSLPSVCAALTLGAAAGSNGFLRRPSTRRRLVRSPSATRLRRARRRPFVRTALRRHGRRHGRDRAPGPWRGGTGIAASAATRRIASSSDMRWPLGALRRTQPRQTIGASRR